MNKVLYALFNIVIPTLISYSVFYVLFIIFKQIPKVGLLISKLGFIPFLILTAYIGYSIYKQDYKLIKQD